MVLLSTACGSFAFMFPVHWQGGTLSEGESSQTMPELAPL